MALKEFLDNNGLLFLWTKLKEIFVQKEAGKGLSSNDFTSAEKTKLATLEKTTIVDNVTSEDSNAALSAKQGNVLRGMIENLAVEAGSGDMLKAKFATIDPANGYVDKAISAKDSASLGGVDASYYAKAEDVPKNMTDLTNNGNYVQDADYVHTDANYTEEEKTKLTGVSEGAQVNVIEKVLVNGVEATPTSKEIRISVPTDNSQIANGAGYQTEAQVNSLITTAMANIDHLKRQVVSQLPDLASASTTTIYMVPMETPAGDNKFSEWMVIDGAWEKTGSSEVDLSGYLQETDVGSISNAAIENILAQ